MTRFVKNSGFEKQLARQRPVKAALKQAAEEVESIAVGTARRGASDDYVQSIKAAEVDGEVIVGTNDFSGHMNEWGSAHQVPDATLRRAVRSAGLELDES